MQTVCRMGQGDFHIVARYIQRKIGENWRCRPVAASQNGSEAGDMLRGLRQRRGLNQADLELDGIITQANYSRIERGLAMPSTEKLDAIFDVLRPTFNERQSILTALGIVPPVLLPTEAKMKTIAARCQPILDELPIPAYIVDIVTRLVGWNDLFVALLGEEGELAEELRGWSLFKAKFAARYELQSFMDEMELHLLEDARGFRERLAPYRKEEWYDGFIEELCSEPGFKDYWDASATLAPPDANPLTFADRILHPVEFPLPGSDDIELAFYSNPEDLQDDSRFQMIYLIPVDQFSMRQVERWRSDYNGENEV